MEIELNHFLLVALVLFTTGMCGVIINLKSIINILLSAELMLLASVINLVAFSAFMNDVTGQIFVMFVLTVASVESAIGLAIMVVYYRSRGNIDVKRANLIRE